MARSKSKRKKPAAPRRRKPVEDKTNRSERLRRRVSRVRPRIFDAESIEDRAVFDEQAFKELPTRIAEEVRAVREALEAVEAGRDEEARQRLATIPRRSSLSDWRLFIGGLIDWYHDDHDRAQQSWQRLDESRRPARIARSLAAAAEMKTSQNAETLTDPDVRSAAKLVCRLRFERPALQEAQTETARREVGPEDVSQEEWVGPQKLQWLIDFSKDHRRTEPELVEDLNRAALARLYSLPYADLFEIAARGLKGPLHDPDNRLLAFLYHDRFQDGNRLAEQSIEAYLEELKANERLPERLRAALISEVNLLLAMQEVAPQNSGILMARLLREDEDRQRIDKHFREAAKAYPASQEAHRQYIQWLRSHCEDTTVRKQHREWYEKKLPAAMAAWSKGNPDEAEPRLWLVDHYLQNEKTEAAEPHVQWLTASRHPDPRVRATKWKWHLLEAMRCSRRKTWLDQAAEHLASAEAIWPSWVDRDWLGYLHAALALRKGEEAEFQRLREEAREKLGRDDRYDLVDAAMALAAAQRMRIPADPLKVFREPIDRAVKSLDRLPEEQLMACGKFFLDLHRTGMLYPAYRMHGGKLSGELYRRLRWKPRNALQGKDTDNDEFWSAVFWLTEKREFIQDDSLRIPAVVEHSGTPVQHAVIKLHLMCSGVAYLFNQLGSETDSIELLKGAATTETDPYLRHWYASLAERAEEMLAEQRRRFGNFTDFFEMAAFPSGDDEDDWDEEDDEFNPNAFDPRCDCEHCTATRERLGIPHPHETDGAKSGDAESGPRWRIDPGELGRQENQDPAIEPPPELTARKPPPLPDFEVRRKRPKNPMAKRRRKKNKGRS